MKRSSRDEPIWIVIHICMNRAFTKEEVQMAKKYIKKCPPSLAIKEMQIKTILRF
jgi:hypothetical protein